MRRASWDPLLSNKRSMVHRGRKCRWRGRGPKGAGWTWGSCAGGLGRGSEGAGPGQDEVGVDLVQYLFWADPTLTASLTLVSSTPTCQILQSLLSTPTSAYALVQPLPLWTKESTPFTLGTKASNI